MSARWTGFTGAMVGALAGLLISTLAFIIVVDPHDHLSISPDVLRAPINSNQRYSYPAIARDDTFNSVIVGTSTVRLVQPKLLSSLLGARFANLAMNSATAYEQSRMIELFTRHHPNSEWLLIGLDDVWCQAQGEPPLYTTREFPEWLYDANSFNDFFYILNGPTIEQSVRQVQFWLGVREPRYGFDGYRSFVPPDSEYDLARVRRHLYGGDGTPIQRNGVSVEIDEITKTTWDFQALDLLRDVLQALPSDTRKIVIFVPYHVYIQPLPSTERGQQLTECKRRVAEMAGAINHTEVLDFMIPSDFTRTDEHYWDPLHYTVLAGERLVRTIAAAVRPDSRPSSDYVRLFPRNH